MLVYTYVVINSFVGGHTNKCAYTYVYGQKQLQKAYIHICTQMQRLIKAKKFNRYLSKVFLFNDIYKVCSQL